MNQSLSAPDVVTIGAHILDVHAWPVDEIGPGQSSVVIVTIKLSAAGTAAGTAIDLAKLGLAVTTIGCVGDDTVGDLVLTLLSKHGVDVSQVVRRSGPPTSATVLPIRRNGERPALHVRGANELFGIDDIDATLVARAPFLHIGGPDETTGLDPDGLRLLVEHARRAGVVVTADLLRGSADTYLAAATVALRDVSFFMPNLDQLLQLASAGTVAAAVTRLRELGFGATFVIKLGEHGSVLIPPEGEWTHLPSYPIDVVDTTGCGDGYCAGFIAGLHRGLAVVDAAVAGTRAGALVASGLGSDAGITGAHQLDDEHHPPLKVAAVTPRELDTLLGLAAG